MSTPGEQTRDPAEAPPRARILFAIPALAALAVFGVFFWGLSSGSDDLPSTLIGRQAPEFDPPPVMGRSLGFSDDLKGEVSLVNVFASFPRPDRG